MKPHTLAALRKMLSKRLTEEDLFEITFHTQGIEDNPANRPSIVCCSTKTNGCRTMLHGCSHTSTFTAISGSILASMN